LDRLMQHITDDFQSFLDLAYLNRLTAKTEMTQPNV
jgi:hypothetical protein